jgi:hypothetical protein
MEGFVLCVAEGGAAWDWRCAEVHAWRTFILGVGGGESSARLATADSVSEVVMETLDKVGNGGSSVWVFGVFVVGCCWLGPFLLIGDEGGDMTCAGRYFS